MQSVKIAALNIGTNFGSNKAQPVPTQAITEIPLSVYEKDATATFALAADPRFSFCLFVPDRPSALLVVVHGSYRNFQEHRDQFADFALDHRCIVLAPLFPAGVRGDGNLDGYKYIREEDIRYDNVLLAMVGQVASRYGLGSHRFGLVGFSGGGHFAHRFLLLHPGRLWGVSVGAPGSVTLLDHDLDWWPGIGDMGVKFGIAPDMKALSGVPVQLLVGDRDLDTAGIVHQPGSQNWRPGAERAGLNRRERLSSLQRSFQANGISVRFEELPGIGHDAWPIFEASKPFLAQSLATDRANTSEAGPAETTP